MSVLWHRLKIRKPSPAGRTWGTPEELSFTVIDFNWESDLPGNIRRIMDRYPGHVLVSDEMIHTPVGVQ